MNEISNFSGTNSGSVSAFSINRTTGDLTLLNVVSSQGAGPAHLSVDPLGQYVFVANYDGGSIAVLPIQTNGSLGNFTDVQVDVDALGPTHATNVPPGDGPRHFAFHPNGRWFYSLQEEASTLLFYSYDAVSGVLTQQQMISTLPAAFVGTNLTSEVRVSQDGKFVYAANRLHDTIAVFSVDRSGKLSRVGETSTLGDYPRSFTIDPTGRYLFSCNQRSDAITTFRVQEEDDGKDDKDEKALRFTGQYTAVGSPAIIVFLT